MGGWERIARSKTSSSHFGPPHGHSASFADTKVSLTEPPTAVLIASLHDITKAPVQGAFVIWRMGEDSNLR